MQQSLDRPRPLVFAHRGGSKIGPENTIAAFDGGLQAGADGLELDVHLSRDGIVVVHHDALLDRTTRGNGPVRERTASELATLDVPTLDQVLSRYSGTRLIIELKESTTALAQAVTQAVQRAGAVHRVCVGSFSVSALKAVRSADPRISTSAGRFEVRMALYRSWINLSPGSVPYRAFQVPEVSGSTRVVSAKFVELAHRAGLLVQVWTVDEPDDMRRLLDWGVDGIISDRPDVAARTVGDWLKTQGSGLTLDSRLKS